MLGQEVPHPRSNCLTSGLIAIDPKRSVRLRWAPNGCRDLPRPCRAPPRNWRRPDFPRANPHRCPSRPPCPDIPGFAIIAPADLLQTWSQWRSESWVPDKWIQRKRILQATNWVSCSDKNVHVLKFPYFMTRLFISHICHRETGGHYENENVGKCHEM